ncbi:MAG TPA: hypothetical protein VM537_10545 [Anaerolineae bacterium]|nr:hypothetical protein [Anaerolineae bacterium]
MAASKIRQIFEELKEDLPLKRTVVLRIVPMKGHASCSLSDSEKLITICINSRDSETVQTDSIIHEYGHAMEYDQLGNHSKFWGECQAKAYTAWAKRH